MSSAAERKTLIRDAPNLKRPAGGSLANPVSVQERTVRRAWRGERAAGQRKGTLSTARDIDGRLLWPPSPKDTAALAGSTFTRHAVVATAALAC